MAELWIAAEAEVIYVHGAVIKALLEIERLFKASVFYKLFSKTKTSEQMCEK